MSDVLRRLYRHIERAVQDMEMAEQRNAPRELQERIAERHQAALEAYGKAETTADPAVVAAFRQWLRQEGGR
jgi:predicted glycosyl hydrolase (DUF1957 family)